MKTPVRFGFFWLLLILGLTNPSWAQDKSLPYYQAGNTFYGQQNYAQAIRYYQYATQLNPQLWQAYQGLGNCYYAQGDKATALTNYQKALDLNPNNPQLSQFVQTLQAQNPAPAAPSGGTEAASSTAPSSSVSPNAAGGSLNRNLPKNGKIVFEVELSGATGTLDDLNYYYGGTLTSVSSPVASKLGLGAAYVISPNFQLGARAEFILKQPISVSFGGGAETDQWTENAIGGALVAEGDFSLGDGINFIGAAEGGFYTLVGSTLSISVSGLGSATGDLTGSGPGGMVSAGVEFLMDSQKSWSIDLGLAYQFLSISPVTGTAYGASATLKNPDGSNTNLDFSGAGLFLGARFF